MNIVPQEWRTEMENALKLNGNLKLALSGDVNKLQMDSFLYNDCFLQTNNHHAKNNYESNYSFVKNVIWDVVHAIPGLGKIKNAVGSEKKFEAVFSKELNEAILSGKKVIDKSSTGNGLYTPNIREVGNRGFSDQLKLKEVLPDSKVSEILMSVQMMAVQKSLSKISESIEFLDSKLNEVLLGQQNDRIAYIQSGYNIFLQSKVNESMKQYLLPIAIGQINLGREQLIYSIQSGIKSICEYKTGFWALPQQLFSGSDVLSIQKASIEQLKSSIDFVLRSSQLLSLIFQECGESYSLIQSTIRLNDVFSKFNGDVYEKLQTWDGDYDYTKMESGVNALKKGIDENIISLVSLPKEIIIDL